MGRFSIIGIISVVFLVPAIGGFAQSSRESDCICRQTSTLVCAGCAGTGVMRKPCGDCKATGQSKCTRCGNDAVAPKAKKDLSEDEQRKLSELEKLLKELGAKAADTSKLPKEKAPQAGKVDCPVDLCRGGTIPWEGGKTNSCLVCGNAGLIRCVECRGGTAPCRTCGGDKTIAKTCDVCAGNGKIACMICKPKALDDRCPLCSGRPSRSCGLCERQAHFPAPCGTCGQSGTTACKDCFGSERVPCDTCAGCGKIRIKVVFVDTGGTGNGGVRSCESCEGKGFRKCTDCKKGLAACPGCDGKKVITKKCVTKPTCICTNDGVAASFEAVGDTLLSVKATKSAKKHFEHAYFLIDSSPLPTSIEERNARQKTIARLKDKAAKANASSGF